MENWWACMVVPDGVCTGNCRFCSIIGDCRYCDEFQTETFERCSDCVHRPLLDKILETLYTDIDSQFH